MSRKTRRNASKNAAKAIRTAAERLSYTRLGISSLAMGSVAFSGHAFAGEAATTAVATEPDQLTEITITGIRASLQRALDIKQNSVGVVDAISAEDIGQFPDSNLAEALQRIPGVTVSRGASSMGGTGAATTTGDGTEITVRGFGPTFNETLIDGRQIASGVNTRAFDFSSLGSDFVGEVDILKTPDAALSSGAIGATINIKYPKPFDYPGLKVAATIAGTDNSYASKITPVGGALISDTFADDRIGVLADFAYSEHKTQANHVNIQGWEGFQLAPSQLAGAPAGASTAGSLPSWDIQDYGVYQEDTKDERIDGRLAVQWRPIDSLLITLNDDYSRDFVQQAQYGYSVWFNQGSLTDVVRASDGTLTSFVQPNTPTDFQGQFNGSVIRNNEFGANVAWDVTDQFKGELDIAQSASKLNPNGELSSIDADVGYGPSGPGSSCLAGVGAPQCNGTSMGIAGVGTGNLPYPTGIGPNGNTALFINNGLIGSHVLPESSPQNTEIVNQFKVMGTWAQDKLRAKFGFQYIDDAKNLRERDSFANNDWQAYAGYGPASDNSGGVALPQSFFGNSFGTAGFIPGFGNSGKLPARILQYNPYTIVSYLQSLGNPQTTVIPGANTTCCNPAFQGVYTMASNNSLTQRIEEKTLAPFVNFSDEVPIGSMTLSENVGVRFENTNVYSSGVGAAPIALTVQAADHTAFNVTYGPTSLITNRNRYTNILPSVDLNLNITPTLKLRFDASRTLTRPPLSDITPVLNLATSERVNTLVATGGNPGLLPFTSDNVDLGAEWYYARNSYISVDAFVKEINNFIVGGSTQQTINGVIDPTTGKPGVFTVTTEVNGPSAEVRGVEVGFQHMLWDTGFGLQANATFVGTNKPYNANDLLVNQFAVTGLANSANLVAFFEKWGFHARVAVNWRDEYLDHFGQLQNNSGFGIEPTFVNSETEVDFSSSYDVTKNVSVFFEGLNLNNSTYSTHGRYSEQVLDVVAYGRRFTLGARFHL
jgi:iron complex outermembrane receptor protein